LKKGKILVVDDNANIRSALKLLLPAYFAEVELIASPKVLMSAVQSFKPDVVLLDMNFHTDINTGGEGLFWTGELKKAFPSLQIVLFTAYADISLAVEGMKRGAFDFIVKPWDNDKLIETLKGAVAEGQQVQKSAGRQHGAADQHPAGRASAVTAALTRQPGSPAGGEMYWGDSAAMAAIRRTVAKVAPTDATILITGENGTGKDVLAREIHVQSQRAQGPMVSVDAGAIPESLFEGELFGHVKGAFTDARSDHAGKFEQAAGGTLFLDEIANIPLVLQAKLLRVLQSRMVTRVGSEVSVPVDIRLVCATNGDIEWMVSEGRFREDLYYRINTVHLHLPALRERPDDILPLAERFMRQYAAKYHRHVTSIADDAVTLLRQHTWSGNIRELQNVIEKAVILSEGTTLLPQDCSLRPEPIRSFASAHTADGESRTAPPASLAETEEQLIRNTLTRYGGNLTLVAKELGISRPTLYSKLKKYDI